MRKLISIVLILCGFLSARSQEFRCTVTVNPQKLLTTNQQYGSENDKKVFDVMKQAIEDFVNGRRWTNMDFQQQEQIECSFTLILSQRTSATDFAGQLTIQLKRPVYNSAYTTGLLNYLEHTNLSFSFNESQPLDFDLNNYTSVLSSVLGYYCYIMLGLYFDSFAPAGGDPFYQLAQQVVQAASTSGSSGWDSKHSRNRYWFMENHTNSAYAPLRSAYYLYHRLGLDLMTRDQEKARQNIIQSLQSLQQAAQTNPGALAIQQFMDVKIQEIVSIFTPAPPAEQKQIYSLVSAISPINTVKVKPFSGK